MSRPMLDGRWRASCAVFLVAVAGWAPPAFAGSRDYELAFIDLSPANVPAPAKRLVELLRDDLPTSVRSESGQEGTRVVTLPTGRAATLFAAGCPATVKHRKSLSDFLVHEAQDGAIAYCYDAARRRVFLSYIDADGVEQARVDVHLRPDGPMPGSMVRSQRRAALQFLAASIDFSP